MLTLLFITFCRFAAMILRFHAAVTPDDAATIDFIDFSDAAAMRYFSYARVAAGCLPITPPPLFDAAAMLTIVAITLLPCFDRLYHSTLLLIVYATCAICRAPLRH